MKDSTQRDFTLEETKLNSHLLTVYVASTSTGIHDELQCFVGAAVLFIQSIINI